MKKLWLHPNVHTFTRSDTEIQLGIHPQRAVVMSNHAHELLRLCDGQFSIDELCQQLGDHLPEVREFVTLLVRNHLLIESSSFIPHHPINEIQRLNHFREVGCANDLAQRRGETEISLHGAGRLGTTIALLLASSGYPAIRTHDDRLVAGEDVTAWGASRIDIGHRRDRICALLMERANRGALNRQLHPRMNTTKRLAVVITDQSGDWPWLDPLEVDAHLESSTPHIVATVAHSAARWSNVIMPGQGACTRCDYQRTVDSDPQWAMISAQLRNRPALDLAPASLILATATHIVATIENWLSSVTQPSGAHLLEWPDLQESFSPWSSHPACGCSWE